MKLKKVGFYKELKYGNADGGSIFNVQSETEYVLEKELVQYLTEGVVFVVSAGISKDIIGKGVIGSPDILTDGEWCWCKDLAYYVKKYHLELPSEFLECVNRNQFKIPSVSVESLEM